MKYIAHMDSGQEFPCEFNEDLREVLDADPSNEGWLVDTVGVIISVTHLVALVPVVATVESAPDESASVKPKRIIDNDGNIWHLCPNGYYSLDVVNQVATWTAEEIQETYGIKQFIKD